MFLNFIYSFIPQSLKINWLLLFIAILLASIGCLFLYSAAGGSYDPWAKMQLLRFLLGIVVFLYVSSMSLKFWLNYSYVIYLFSLILLVCVYIFGDTGMGAQRWLDLGFMRIQPSELMKFSLILLISKYYQDEKEYTLLVKFASVIVILFFIFIPSYLIYLQPDLGGAIILLLVGITVMFLIGISAWFFVFATISIVFFSPIIWTYFLKEYQQNRILTFLDPLRDPLGAGYHIIQSKIALGSGGFWGKGFMKGTQSQLNFLPEMQTDFIFTLISEEWGMIGSICILLVYLLLITYCFIVGIISNNYFGAFLSMGVGVILFYSVCIIISMVMGLVPVVGVPLPLISYGGSSMICNMFGLGLVSNTYINRNINIERAKNSDL